MGLLEKMLRYDTAVYWAPKGQTDVGHPSFDNPVDVKCRWETGGELIVTIEKEERLARDKIYVEIDMEEGGMIWHGKKQDLPNVKPPKDALRIAQFVKIPNLKNKKYIRYVLT